jgi:hypothetical protein
VTDTGSLVDELRRSLGVRRLSDLASLQPSASWFEAVGEAYSRLSAARPEPPPRQSDELRPVIATSSQSPIDEAEVVARSLLLAPSVAILLPDSINYARRLLRLATLLEPVLDAGLVVLLPETSLPDSRYFDTALMHAYRSIPSTQAQREQRAKEATSRFETALAMDAAAHFPDRLDLALTDGQQVSYVKDLLRSTFRTGDGRLDADRYRFLPDLIALEIPRIALATDELVRLRQDGLFEDLRRGLTEAMRRTSTIDDEAVVDPASVRVQEVREYLADVVAESVRETMRSRVIRSATTGTFAIGIGAVSGALGSSGGMEVAAIAGGAGSAAGLVLGWLGGRPRSGTKRFRRLVTRLFAD